jgi:protein phosphatase
MDVAVGSHAGWQEYNGEAFLSERLAPGVALLAVADGFGTIRGGPVSGIALEALRDALRRRTKLSSLPTANPAVLRTAILSAFASANARVYAQTGSHEDYVSGGTSVTAILIAGARAIVGHVGESRAYLRRDGEMRSLTEDDALAFAEPRSSGNVIPAEAPALSLLTRTLGTQPTLEASILELTLAAGDALLLCTDGVHRHVGQELMMNALHVQASGEAVATILGAARVGGNTDGATVVIARIIDNHDDALLQHEPLQGRLKAALAIAAVMVAFIVYTVIQLWPSSGAR